MGPTRRSPIIPLGEYMLAQLDEVDSPLNEWGAGEEFGHQPNLVERVEHYIRCGRAEQFCAAHSDDNIWYTSRALGCDIRLLKSLLRERVLVAFFDLWHDAVANWERQYGRPFPLEDFFPP